MGHGLRLERLAQRCFESRTVRHTSCVHLESGVGNQFGPPNGATQALPIPLVRATHGDVPVAGGQGLIRGGYLVGRSVGPRKSAGGEIDRRFPYRVGHSGFHQGRVDVLPFAGLEPVHVGREDAVGREQPGVEVGDRDADLHGRLSGMAGHAHDARVSLRHEVEPRLVLVRTRATEPGDGRVDDGRVDGTNVLVPQPEALQASGAKVLDEDVRVPRHIADDLGPLRLLHVDNDAALVTSDVEEGRRFARHERRPRTADIVPSVRLLDLDDVRSHVSQEHGAERSRHDLSNVDDSNAR